LGGEERQELRRLEPGVGCGQWGKAEPRGSD